MPPAIDSRLPPHINLDGHGLFLNTITGPNHRRESSSSRSNSAIISTPLASYENLHEMVRVASRGDLQEDRDISQSVRRTGEQERTKSWAQTQFQGQDDEDRLLKPPSQEPTRRPNSISLEQPAELEPSSKRSSRSSCDYTTYKLARRVRRTSSALSASINSTTSGSEDDPTDMTPAELGRRIIARERDQREKRFKIAERRAALKKESTKSESVVDLEPQEVVKPVVKPNKPKEAIVSIGELVKRHKEAMAKPTAAVKDRARKELGMAIAKPPASVSSTRSSKKSSDTPLARRKGETPIIPARTSSTPDAVVGIVPPRTSSKTDIVSLTLARTISDTRSATTDNRSTTTDNRSTTTCTGSVARNAALALAALEQLELDDRPMSRCSRKISFQDQRSPSRLKKERPSMTPSRENLSATSIKEDEEQEALAVALYLRSPNLNRYFSFPRQSPDPPLRVSVAELGSLTGSPILMFLGLGCVRYLTALFDDLAKALDLRLICIDRWGYGKTDMVDESKRGLREWAAIVERVMEEMKVKQFSVLAHSAGCPYALAAANRMKERVVGKIHLLAPWVGTDVDNSYKWLKWVPDGIIKSATAAEWKLQSYFLGKPPPLTYSPIGHTAQAASSSSYLPLGSARNASMLSVAVKTRKPSLFHRASSMVLRTKNDNLSIPETEYVNLSELTQVQSGILPMRPLPTTNPKNWRGIGHEMPKVDKKDLTRLQPPGSNKSDPWKSSSRNSSSLSLNRIPSSSNPNTPRQLDFGLSEGFDRFPSDMLAKPLGSTSSPTPKKKGFTAYSYSYSYSYSRAPTASSSKISQRPDSPTRPPGPSFGVALQQASHAECEPGTTSDLLSIVLGRQHANRPWQYALNYADFSLPVKIYWGKDDDKISEKSVRWMEKTMVAGVELLVLEGEGHNLMTSSGVMLSVFQSLREEVTAASLGPQPDLRLY